MDERILNGELLSWCSTEKIGITRDKEGYRETLVL
jgi:hypothetical protein